VGSKNCSELATMGFNNIQHGKTKKEHLNYPLVN
jgi:hypothetical protein